MSKPLLLVEDNEDDVFFMRQALKKVGIQNPLHVVEDGQNALDYLAGRGQFADRTAHPLPFLVLLDLKLPYVPGLEVLQWIRERPELQTMLVVVLTSSREDKDIDTAYRLGVNSYLVKPPTVDKLEEMTKAIGDYWFHRNQPPSAVGV